MRLAIADKIQKTNERMMLLGYAIANNSVSKKPVLQELSPILRLVAESYRQS